MYFLGGIFLCRGSDVHVSRTKKRGYMPLPVLRAGVQSAELRVLYLVRFFYDDVLARLKRSCLLCVCVCLQGLEKPTASDVDVVEFLVPLSTSDSVWEPDVRVPPTPATLR